MFERIVKFLGADRETQKKRIVKNCVDMILYSHIDTKQISPVESSLVLNEVRKEVLERLKESLKQKEMEVEQISHSLLNISFNDTAK